MPSARRGQPYVGPQSPMRIEDEHGNRMAAIRTSGGLPFQAMPGADASDPRSKLELDFQQQANQVQQEYERKFEIIMRNSRLLGQQKAMAMLADLDIRADEEANRLMQQRQQQVAFLDSIDQMEQAGLLGNGDELRWRAIAGRDVASAMFPREREQVIDVSQARREVQTEITRLQKELAKYERHDKWNVGPFRSGYQTYIKEDPETGKRRPATPFELEHQALVRKDLARMTGRYKALLMGGKTAQYAARAIQSDRVPSSTFGDKVMATKTLQHKPKVIRVKLKSTGQTGTIPANEFDPRIYEKL